MAQYFLNDNIKSHCSDERRDPWDSCLNNKADLKRLYNFLLIFPCQCTIFGVHLKIKSFIQLVTAILEWNCAFITKVIK